MMTAAQLKKYGYRVVSLKHRIVSRIDVENWQEFHKSSDFYRRCISKDTIIVPASYLPKIPNSGHSEVGYVEKPIDIPQTTNCNQRAQNKLSSIP